MELIGRVCPGGDSHGGIYPGRDFFWGELSEGDLPGGKLSLWGSCPGGTIRGESSPSPLTPFLM